MQHITMTVLKSFGLGLRQRGNFGEAKVNIVGNTPRVTISSAGIKKPARKYFNEGLVRTSHMKDLITTYVNDLVDAGEVKVPDGKNRDTFVADLIKKVALGFGIGATKKGKENDENAKESSGVIASYPFEAVKSIIKGIIALTTDKDSPLKGTKDDETIIKAEAKKILDSFPITYDEAVWGLMDTGAGAASTIYGAGRVSVAYSVNRYHGDSNFWTSTSQIPEVKSTDDLFFDSYNKFRVEQATASGSDNMGTSDIYSNTFKVSASCNIDTLKDNLTLRNKPENLDELVKEHTYKFFESLIVTNPEARQNAEFSAPTPDVIYFEAVRNGSTPITPEYTEPVEGDKKGVVREAMEQLAVFASDDMSRVGEITRYVMIAKKYKDMEDLFISAGCKVIKNLAELKDVIYNEVASMVG